MKAIISILLLSILFVSCKKSSVANFSQGNYNGTFQRTTNGVPGAVSQVTLHFSATEFSGTSTVPRYPAICNGTYTTSSSKINISSNCVWTADFDWTLIFDGEYNFQENNGQLKIWKTVGNVLDEYVLNKN